MNQNKTVAKAVYNGMRTSPTKLRLVADNIRNLNVSDALLQLDFSKKRVAKHVKTCLLSAVANAENNHYMNVDLLRIDEIYVDKGLVLKRIRARARGRAGKIKKFFSNLTIKLSEKVEE